MTFTREHLDQLRNLIEEHKSHIRHLQLAIDRINHQISVHERVVQLAENARLLDLLSEVAQNAESARAASSDPKAFARSRGASIPDELDVRVEVRSAGMTVRGGFDDELYPVEFVWDSERGFEGRVLNLESLRSKHLQQAQVDGTRMS